MKIDFTVRIIMLFLICGMTINVATLTVSEASTVTWWDMNRSFRLPVTVDAAGFERVEKPVDVNINFTQLLSGMGRTGTLDENSIRIVEINSIGTILNTSVQFQFDRDSNFNAATKASGNIIFIMSGTTPSNGNRYYNIYFDVTGGSFTPLPVTPSVTLTDNVIDQGMSSYKIQITDSTFFFQKEAGGFSSWDDKSGNDWIGWSTAKSSNGVYRGIPNALPGVFHPGFNCCVSTIVSQGPIKIRILSRNGTSSESIWDIYPQYATMSMTKVGMPYWFLYEGTPGGVFEPSKDFMYKSNGIKTYLNTSWTGDLSGNEWSYFGDPTVGRSLFVTHQEDDIFTDSYWAHSNMTVFGFGRGNKSDMKAYLSNVPQHFTIGLLEGTDFTQNSKMINSAYKDLIITSGSAEQYGIITPPSIVVHPADNIVVEGQTATFSIVATGSSPLSYQWQKNGVNISGATSSIYVTPVTTLADNGSTYRSIVTNSAGSIISNSGKLVVVKASGNISVVNESRLTFDSTSKERQYAWSPDGQWLAFASNRVGGWGIYKMKVDGSSPIITLNNSGSSLEPAWDPMNRILFSIAVFGSEDVYAMNTDGSNVTRLTTALNYDEYPDWSPDGSKIVWSSANGSSTGEPKQLWVMNADGSNKKRLNTIYGIQPTWSPDGTKITFKSYAAGKANIWVINSNGSNPKQLTFDTTSTHDPDWSPDSRYITYASRQDGDFEIYVIKADGTGKQKLTNNVGYDDNFPAWSPNGKYIVYSSNRTGNEEIWMMELNYSSGTGSTPTPLYVSVRENPDPVTSGETSQVSAYVTTTGSIPVSGANVTASVTRGSLNLTGGITDANGYFNITYTAPALEASTQYAISAAVSKTGYTAGSGTDQITVNPVPAPPFLNSINITPNPLSLAVESNLTFTASPKDQFNAPYLATVIWSSSNITVGSVDTSGKFTALNPGTAMVNATNDSVTGTAFVTVNPAPSALVISSITAASGKTYSQDTLAIGKLFFIDRTYTFTSVPTSYNNLKYIKTANYDRYNKAGTFLQFDVNTDVTVYVAYDDRILTKVNWLSTFTDTGDNLVRSDGETYSMYARTFPAGHVSLGGCSITGAGGMYIVIVEPQGTPSSPILSVSISESPYPVTSGEISQVTVHVTSSGSNVTGANVDVSVIGGSLGSSSGTTDTNGDFKTIYTAPNVTTSTTYTISATASMTGYTAGSGTDLITVTPPAGTTSPLIINIGSEVFNGSTYPTVTLENSIQKVVIRTKKGGAGGNESAIQDWILKSTGNDLVTKYLDANSFRGVLSSATITDNGENNKTVRMNYVFGSIVEYTIYNNSPIIKIKYEKYNASTTSNIVDYINMAGATRVYGQGGWIRPITYSPCAYWDTYDTTLTGCIGITYGPDTANAGSLNYNGNIIMAFGQTTSNGIGFGRVMPIYTEPNGGIRILKISSAGIFESYQAISSAQLTRPAHYGYIYLFQQGVDNAITQGQQIVDEALLP